MPIPGRRKRALLAAAIVLLSGVGLLQLRAVAAPRLCRAGKSYRLLPAKPRARAGATCGLLPERLRRNLRAEDVVEVLMVADGATEPEPGRVIITAADRGRYTAGKDACSGRPLEFGAEHVREIVHTPVREPAPRGAPRPMRFVGPVKGRGYEGALFLGDGPAPWRLLGWTPSAAQIAAAEAALLPHLRCRPPDRGSRLAGKLARYKRQYAGVTEQAHRAIFIQFLCDEAAARMPEWRSRLIAVDDGGDCYFQAWYDVDAGSFYRFYVNGEA